MMQALAKLESKPGLTLTAVEKPAPGYNDVLIKIKKTAICGTDMHIYNWDEWAQKTIPVPMHVGHEFVGEIVAMGEGVQGFEIGERVSGEGHIVCGHCRNCRSGNLHLCPKTIGVGVNRPGAFAQYLCIPASNAYKIPDNVSDDIASIMDPLGNAVHTALSFDLVGEDVLIVGAGPIGMMAAAVCRHAGARYIVITDVNDYRLDMAKQFGVTETVNVGDAKDHTDAVAKIKTVMNKIGMKEGFDVGLEMSGNARAIATMVETMNTGGRLALLGLSGKDSIPIDWDKVVFKGLHLKGIYGREMFDTWYKMIAMLQSGLNVDNIITHRLHYTEFEKGFDAIRSGKAGKVVLSWD